MRKKYLFLLMIGLVLLVAGRVSGYVIEPELILSLMADKIGSTSGFVAKQAVLLDLFPCGGENAEGFSETVWYDPPDKFRAESASEDRSSIYVAAGGEFVSILNQTVLSTGENRLMLYREPLLFRDRHALAARLAALGVDMTTSSLGRLGGQVAYVIGAQYPDESVSQLWVNKETLLPCRLLLRGSAGLHSFSEKTLAGKTLAGQTLAGSPVESSPEAPAEPLAEPPIEMIDVVYSDWRKEGAFFYPWRIEIYRGSAIIRVLCCQSLASQSSFADNFFNTDELRKTFSSPDADTPEAGGAPPNDAERTDVERTIDDFRKLYQ